MAEDSTSPPHATSFIETTRGVLSYSQLAPLLAERALRRAVRKVREENNRLGLPLIVWQNGRVARIYPQP